MLCEWLRSGVLEVTNRRHSSCSKSNRALEDITNDVPASEERDIEDLLCIRLVSCNFSLVDCTPRLAATAHSG